MTVSRSHERYLRQSQFDPIGELGQQRIEAAHVAVLGCGALGTVAADQLARAGVGRLRLIDRDLVEWSNLQRQSLYTEADAEAGAAKVEAAAHHLRQINSSIHIEEHVVDITPANISQQLEGADIVIDATDNFAARLLLNDWSLKTQTPWIHGGCIGANGQVRLFTGAAPCLRCLLPHPPAPGETATCDTAGVIAPATHLIASLQVCEAIKWISGNRSNVRSEILSVDLWHNQFRSIALSADPSCPACGLRRYDFLDAEEDVSAESLCGRDAVQIAGSGQRVDLQRMSNAWQSIGTVKTSRFFVRLSLPDERTVTLFRDGRAVISGVRDIPHARSLFDRYVGS
ncbi:ThiF family adenylyltransferase [Allorhodopirellula solitaria]|uniref:Molybdopterin-synthase adenylyltransferase n=1 Tax=Allorhodopirellula solitaria TaxID=2527987 RepID=A0A5C5YEF6_9BACT|nr:ThiF family adenylyltransferase [Allorhodopirellula solitaria]TWT74137.1 Molybdopterin-synthase adenylyltransferase [Allorhodopirellula solitaria]